MDNTPENKTEQKETREAEIRSWNRLRLVGNFAAALGVFFTAQNMAYFATSVDEKLATDFNACVESKKAGKECTPAQKEVYDGLNAEGEKLKMSLMLGIVGFGAGTLARAQLSRFKPPSQQ